MNNKRNKFKSNDIVLMTSKKWIDPTRPWVAQRVMERADRNFWESKGFYNLDKYEFSVHEDCLILLQRQK